ncbi:2-amino-3,7-dideoxy-D-threo-hept-6-ulosonate synthase [Streptomyces sp. NPDC101151]|uniref:2-amino-3,7-dideoxy-D-threo-hept-6-ulosonate synthase n=1 Tax=Streptomyces sp. NPDC101151 TaxID=3366115 RepID=UPI0037F1E657
MSEGKKLRLRRLISDQGRSLIVPMDHGISVGAVTGLRDIAATVERVSVGGADAVVLHKGLVQTCARRLRASTSLIVHMSASTTLGRHINRKVAVCTVPEAARLGADAVSVHINAGSETEPEQIVDTARIAEECDAWGIPLLAMVYVRGADPQEEFAPAKVAHAARMAAELGADLVKCHYTGDPRSFDEVVEACPVPVLIAGGAAHGDVGQLFTTVGEALGAGAAGVSIGRNIFEHSDPAMLTRHLAKIIHGGLSPAEAYEEYQDLLAGTPSLAPAV